MRARLLAGVPALAFALAACTGSSGLSQSTGAGAPVPGSASGRSAPPSAGSVVRSAHLVDAASVHQLIQSGQPVLLFFMATGCESCAAQAHDVANAVSATPKVKVVGIDMAPDDSGSLTSFLDATGLSGLPFTWAVDRDGALAQQFGVQALDQTVGIAKGSVRFSNPEAADARQLRQQIASL